MSYYKNFTLKVNGERGSYTVECIAPDGMSSEPQSFTFVKEDLPQAALDRIARGKSCSVGDLREMGRAFTRCLFPKRIRDAYRVSLTKEDRERNVLLSLKLCIRPPELSTLPWELMVDPEDDDEGFLALRVDRPISRYIEDITYASSLRSRLPLRVIYLSASSNDLLPLEIERSEQKFREALAPLGESNIEIISLAQAKRQDLHDALTKGAHILHFDGHARFKDGKGSLAINAENGHALEIDSKGLARLLKGTSIRLVVLSACDTAVTAGNESDEGMAQTLIKAGNLPAVVAMQAQISDDAAILFNRTFYKALKDGLSVDAAVVDARKRLAPTTAIESRDLNKMIEMDWIVPILFLRSEDSNVLQSPDLDVNLAELSEWKDLHERVDALLHGVIDFKVFLDRTSSEGRKIPRHKDVQEDHSFKEVERRLNKIIDWKPTLISIDDIVNNFTLFRNQIHEIATGEPQVNIVDHSLHYLLDWDVAWWRSLRNVTVNLTHTTRDMMTEVDRKLRDKTFEIQQMSQK